MEKHTHRFVEEYDGLMGFGFSREVDEKTLTYYLQKFSDDQFMALIRGRMSDKDMEALFDFLTRLMKQYLTEEEYHRYFLKDEEP
ncbi:MAG: cytoplasmic protein [Deltaproteobacteria bacterium]|nr:cytoplasmic protein [Deltaproteobacteria bacterium]MBW2119018.1 cytoplasmic protein [Deltaproteobacteria bacterium]MBW2344425.1 cytoplasmic protein [Deltaproteobacteria bacterium]